MTKKPFVAILSLTFLVILAFLPVNGFADTATIKPSNQDITIDAGNPLTNYNYLTSMSVRAFSPNQMRCLVQFDLSSIPAGSMIDSANMSLYKQGWSTLDPGGRIYGVYRVTQSWMEASATWNTYDGTNPWGTPGSDYITTGGASAVVPSGNYVWMMWNVTDIVKAWIEDGQPNNGFVVMDGDESTAAPYQALFNSGEWKVNQPILEVSYTPYVGGDIIAADTVSLLAPWMLATVILIGTIVTVRRRLH